MKSLSIRNLSEETYAHLQFLAKANRRSLQEQIKLLLEQEVALIKGAVDPKGWTVNSKTYIGVRLFVYHFGIKDTT
jgi:plasmid stability protein